jgi:hypothetical protein
MSDLALEVLDLYGLTKRETRYWLDGRRAANGELPEDGEWHSLTIYSERRPVWARAR